MGRWELDARKLVPVSRAAASLSQLVDEVDENQEVIGITVSGVGKAALVPLDIYYEMRDLALEALENRNDHNT